MPARAKAAHIWDRDPFDWYVEPEWCSRRLFQAEAFGGSILDPACGMGRIVTSACEAGYEAFGSDIVARWAKATEQDFLKPWFGSWRPNCIVSNPPFGIADKFVKLSLERAKDKVAMLLPATWMCGSARWLETTGLFRVLVLGPRPSMPPGTVIEAGETPGNGTKDAWYIWLNGYRGAPELGWLRRDPDSARVAV
jgi:hypothetical protein